VPILEFVAHLLRTDHVLTSSLAKVMGRAQNNWNSWEALQAQSKTIEAQHKAIEAHKVIESSKGDVETLFNLLCWVGGAGIFAGYVFHNQFMKRMEALERHTYTHA
jgi:hypothetical protein